MSDPPAPVSKMKIEGDNNQQAGRDINNFNVNLPSVATKMGLLVEEYKKEADSNQTFHDIIDDLEHYLSPVVTETKLIGLDRKLEAGGYTHLIEHAQILKEKFAKKLTKYTHFKSAQKIFLFVLADVYTKFTFNIYPQILSGEPESVIFDKIQSDIVEYIEKKLEQNIFDIYSDSIYGMIFFLTGNCHIKWSENVNLPSDV